MIHHISFPAKNPLRVAKVLAELLGNTYYAPFPFYPDGYVVVYVNDKYVTLIEVLDTETILEKGDIPMQYLHNTCSRPISIPIDRLQIESIAQREQWRCLCRSYGYFDAIAFWVENAVLLELATPEMVRRYTTDLSPGHYTAMSNFQVY